MKAHRAYLQFGKAEIKVTTTDPEEIKEIEKRLRAGGDAPHFDGQLVNTGTYARPKWRDNCRYCRAVFSEKDIQSGAADHGLCAACWQEGR